MANPNAPAIFRDACRLWAPLLAKDFGFSAEDCAAILGNAGHESNGLRTMQEIAPTVKGSRGGLGAFQWTGPRRREFEKWLGRKSAAPNDLQASYDFLFRELKGPEKKAVGATKAAVGLEAKVRAFERAYERSGVKHYPSRIAWANTALTLVQDVLKPAPAAKTVAATVKPEVATVEPRTAPTHWWERLLGVKPPAITLIGKLAPNGDPTLFRQQNRLAAGYTEVGDPDGLWGVNTAAAVGIALAEQFPDVEPPDGWPMGDEVLAALAKLDKRKVATARATVTVQDLRDRGSTPIKAPVELVGGGGLLGFLGIGKAIQETVIPDKITAVSDQASDIMGSVQTAIGTLGTVFSLAYRFWWVILIVLGLWWIAKGLKWALEIRALVRQGSIRQTSL